MSAAVRTTTLDQSKSASRSMPSSRACGFGRADRRAVPGAGEDEVVGVQRRAGELGRAFASKRQRAGSSGQDFPGAGARTGSSTMPAALGDRRSSWSGRGSMAQECRPSVERLGGNADSGRRADRYRIRRHSCRRSSWSPVERGGGCPGELVHGSAVGPARRRRDHRVRADIHVPDHRRHGRARAAARQLRVAHQRAHRRAAGHPAGTVPGASPACC